MRRRLHDFPTKEREACYDPDFDALLIEQSLAVQYGILPSQQGNLLFADWYKLVGGLMDNTPLGRVVAVRGETDRKKLAAMGPWAQRIHQQWQAHLARRALETTSPADLRRQMDSLEAAMAKLFGGEP